MVAVGPLAAAWPNALRHRRRYARIVRLDLRLAVLISEIFEMDLPPERQARSHPLHQRPAPLATVRSPLRSSNN